MSHVRCLSIAILIVAALTAPACTSGPHVEPVTFVERNLVRSVDGCEPESADCAWVRLHWIEPDEGSEPARAAIGDWVSARLLEPLGDHWLVESPEDVATSFLADRDDLVAEFPDAATAGWYLERRIRALAAPDGTVSLECRERQYTGGAHGLETVRLATFDAADGRQLDLNDLVGEDRASEFWARADRAFRRARGLDPGDDLQAAGFFLEGGTLPPTDNVARVEGGIRVHYDAYEIAPYSVGPTDLVVDWD